jgi:hypothetical protein
MASAEQISRADLGRKKKCDHERVTQESAPILANAPFVNPEKGASHRQSLSLIQSRQHASD